jgi:putative transcriptional regulator
LCINEATAKRPYHLGIHRKCTTAYIGFFDGGDYSAKVHRMPELDVKAVREQTGFTQAKFAQTFAISLGTLRHWERGDRKPSGTALVLLHAVNRQPKTVMKLLAGISA